MMAMEQSYFHFEGGEQGKGLRFTWVQSIHLDLHQLFLEASSLKLHNSKTRIGPPHTLVRVLVRR